MQRFYDGEILIILHPHTPPHTPPTRDAVADYTSYFLLLAQVATLKSPSQQTHMEGILTEYRRTSN